MKRLIFLFVAVILFSCEKDKKPQQEAKMILQEGYIIGFDPCVRTFSIVVVTNSYKDTLVAYLLYGKDFINRFDTIFKFPGCYEVLNTGDTAFTFPEYYFEKYHNDFLFPDSVRNKYKIFLNYTLLKDEEKIPIMWNEFIDRRSFEKYVRNRQIKINYATKYPIQSLITN